MKPIFKRPYFHRGKNFITLKKVIQDPLKDVGVITKNWGAYTFKIHFSGVVSHVFKHVENYILSQDKS